MTIKKASDPDKEDMYIISGVCHAYFPLTDTFNSRKKSKQIIGIKQFH